MPLSQQPSGQLQPIASTKSVAQQSRANATQQRPPQVESVNSAARPIVADIIEPRGNTVGVLTYDNRGKLGGLEGAGMHSGTVKAR